MVRRLTALLACLVFLPSVILGGRPGCVMGERSEMMASAHGAHHADARSGTHAVTDAVTHAADHHAPGDLPRVPAECISVAACGAAVVVAQTLLFDTPPHATDRVAADATLAPDSPALALEPPPPRA